VGSLLLNSAVLLLNYELTQLLSFRKTTALLDRSLFRVAMAHGPAAFSHISTVALRLTV
jgi:hypothetical protein